MRWVLALLMIASLAGCADAAEPTADEELAIDDSLEATETTGVIRGVVVDPAITPIAGVTVRIASLGVETETDGEGLFGFDGLEPGSYFLEASKLGYVSAQTSTSVQAAVDKPPAVRIMLSADPATTPNFLSFTFKGHMACSLSYIALCGVGGQQYTGDSFLATFPIDSPPDHATIESVWKGTQPTGDQMNLNFGATPAGPGTTFNTSQGPSPLFASANRTMLAEGSVGAGEDLVGRMFAWEMEGTGIDDHTGQCVPVVLTTYCQGPGMALQQDFEFYVHVFYNFSPGADWRFTNDGEPVPPS